MLEPGTAHCPLLLPLGVVVGNKVLRLLARAQRAHQDEAADAGRLRRRHEIGGALLHHTAELLLAPLPDRDEVDDSLATLDGLAQCRSVGQLALDELAAPGFEVLRRAALGVADETADRPVLRAQRVHDLRPDEPGPTRDQNHARDYRRPRLP